MIGGLTQWIGTIHTIGLHKTTGRPSRSSAVTEKGYSITTANTTSMSLFMLAPMLGLFPDLDRCLGRGRSWSVVVGCVVLVHGRAVLVHGAWMAGRPAGRSA